MIAFLSLLQNDDGGGIAAMIGGLIGLLIAVIAVAGMWKVYTKAGQPGWAAIIPFYNIYVLLQIVGRPGWWLLLLLIPGVSFIILIMISIDLAKSFGKSTLYGLGLAFLNVFFFLHLGFSDAKYVGPAAAS